LRDVVQTLLRLGIHLPDHAEIGSGSTEPFLAGRSRTWPNEAKNLVAAPEILIDRFRLGGRFHYDKIHDNPMIYIGLLRLSGVPGLGLRPPGTWVMQPGLSNRYRAAGKASGTPKTAAKWRNCGPSK
jgi:hypothetical protein